MFGHRTSERAAAEDIYFGQVVANWARWFVIADIPAVLMILWTSVDTLKLISGILPVVGLIAQ